MTRYALVIGIAQYDSSLGSLTKPTNDAEAVASILAQPGYGDWQVKRLPEGWNSEKNCYEVARERLNGSDLGQMFQDFIGQQADRKDALIYFSGHGFTVSDNLGKKKGYLATSDCTSNAMPKASEAIATRGIALDSLNQLILESNLSSLVVLLDCCHAGSILESNLVRQSLTAFNSSQKDYYLIAACRDFQSAWEGEEYSVFTEALLKGLSENNAGSDGQVSCDRIFDFIASELKRSGQEPIRMGWGRSITLLQYPSKDAPSPTVVSETCPYQGLRYFDDKTAQFFFGRDKVVDILIQKLEQAAFVPIIGASGSGKSSVVRAGLIPALEKNGWRVLDVIFPGVEPLAELKRAFTKQFERTEIREISHLIDTDGLRPVIERLPGSERWLLVVDQFEEVFTVGFQPEERRQFIELLTQVAEIPASRLAIVTTMRADFLEPCLSYQSLTQLIQNWAVYMPPLEGAQLEEAIASPANLQGYHLETGLLGAILDDVGKEKDCLPLLQFALTELWEKRDRTKHQLTIEQYRILEGVTGALNRHAEKVYTYKDFHKDSPQQQRTPQEQEWIKRIFLRLVRTGEGEKDTKLRQLKSTILSLAGEDSKKQKALRELIEELVKGRLLVTGQEGQDVNLTHEALIEGWQQLNEWRKENREVRRLAERVEKAYQDWVSYQQDSKYLLDGALREEAYNKRQQLKDLSILEKVLDFCFQSFNLYSFETGIDYRILDRLLKTQDWKNADEETAKLMLRAARCEMKGLLDPENMETFPCEDLHKLNQLWQHYSEGKFGFSVQKKIYQNLGGTREYNDEVWKKFSDVVGWDIERWLLTDDDLTFNLNAPKGHLPSFALWNECRLASVSEGFAGGIDNVSIIFYRVETCNL